MNRLKLFNLSHEFSAPAAEDKPIFLPFGTWAYDGKISQTFTREAAARIANELAADVAAGNPGIPVYQGHPDVPSLAAKYPDKGALGWVKKIDLSNEGCSLTVDWDRFPGKGFGWFSPYWFGEKTGLDNQGKTLVAVDHIESIGLVNNPNISEFRLANELQDTNNAAQAEKGNTMNITKEELCKLLGLPPEATDEDIRTALAEAGKAKEALATEKTKLEAAEADKAAAVNECEKVKTELANEKAAHRGILLDNAIADGRISVAGRAAWEKRLSDDFKAGSIALANERPLKRVSAVDGKTPAKTDAVNLVALANERMAKNPGMTYTTAFALVMKEHPEVK